MLFASFLKSIWRMFRFAPCRTDSVSSYYQAQGRPSRSFQPNGDEESELFIGLTTGEQSMKMKLAAFLAVVVLGLAGCGTDNTSNSTNSTTARTKTTNTPNQASWPGQKPDADVL